MDRTATATPDKKLLRHQEWVGEFVKECALDGSVCVHLSQVEGKVLLDRVTEKGDIYPGMEIPCEMLGGMYPQTGGVKSFIEHVQADTVGGDAFPVDRWSRDVFEKEWPRLAATFFIHMVPWNDPFTDLMERWRRYIMVRGFISPFHPHNGVFTTEQAKSFVLGKSILTERPVDGHPGEETPLVMFRLFREGNAWCAAREPFVNIQESDVGFGEFPLEAVAELLRNSDTTSSLKAMQMTEGIPSSD